MSRIYLDACSIIYLVEAAEPYHTQIARAALKPLAESSESCLITSRLSMLECRVKPMKDDAKSLLALYNAFFAAHRLVLAEIDVRVIDTATRLRATYSYRTPDAIHLATAIEEKADAFLTGDAALENCPEIVVNLLLPS